MSEWIAPNSEHAPPKAGEPPLHRAARVGDHDSIRKLIAGGHDPNASFDIELDPGAHPNPATPLMVAAGSGDGAGVETVELLLELGADPTIQLNGRSVVWDAIAGLGWNYRPGGDAERAMLLLEHGAPVGESAGDRNDLLCAGASSGDPARLKIAMGFGGDVNGYFDPEKSKSVAGMMESMMAQANATLLEGMPEQLRALMAEEVLAPSDELDEMLASLQPRDDKPFASDIPLFCAASSGDPECVRMLLEAGADPKQIDNMGATPLAEATSEEVARLLIDAGGSLEVVDQFGRSLVIDAISEGDVPRLRAYLACGADVHATDKSGHNLLLQSMFYPNVEVVRALLDAEADPKSVGNDGENSFHASISDEEPEGLEEQLPLVYALLRERGLDVHQPDSDGVTPLACAADYGTAIHVRALCEAGADPNGCFPGLRDDQSPDEEPQPVPILFAAISDRYGDRAPIIEALLRAGANPLATDLSDATAGSRLVGELCSSQKKTKKLIRSFYDALPFFEADAPVDVDSRHLMIDAVMPIFREYLADFCADFRPDDYERYGLPQQRIDLRECISLMYSYELWWRLWTEQQGNQS